MRILFGIVILASFAAVVLGVPRVEVKRGNEAASQGLSDAAILHYKRALEQQGDSSVISYDLGNVLYGQGDFDGAGQSFLGALDPHDTPTEQSQTLYNLGNSLFQKQQYDKALAAYVESLKRNVDDEDLRYNLELARRMLREQQQQQQSPQNQDQKQDQQQDQQQQPQQPQQQEQERQQEQQQPQPQMDRQMTEEEAERLLNALLQDEQDALKDVRKVKARAKREKDW